MPRIRQRHLLLALLAPLGVILYLDRVCIGLALPRIQDELHIPPEQLGWISLAFSLGYAGFEIPAGHLGDRQGPRSVLTRIVVGWSIFTALTGVVTGLWSMLVVRFLFGAGEAGALPNVASAVSRWFPAQSRAKAVGFFLSATQLGGAISPLLVVPIQQAWGWRVSFFAFGAIGLLWSVAWYVWFRNTPAEKSGVTPEELEELGPKSVAVESSLPWRVALRSRSMWAMSATFFFAIYAVFFGVFWAPTFLQKARGFTEGELRWAAVTWVAGILCNFGGGALSDALVARVGRTWGRRISGATGMFIVASGYAAAALVSGKVATVAALTIASAGWGLSQATCLAMTIDVGRAHAGTVAGVLNTAGQLGGAISAVAFGYLVKATGGYEIPLLVMSGIAVLSALCWAGIDAGKPIVADALPSEFPSAASQVNPASA